MKWFKFLKTHWQMVEIPSIFEIIRSKRNSFYTDIPNDISVFHWDKIVKSADEARCSVQLSCLLLFSFFSWASIPLHFPWNRKIKCNKLWALWQSFAAYTLMIFTVVGMKKKLEYLISWMYRFASWKIAHIYTFIVLVVKHFCICN